MDEKYVTKLDFNVVSLRQRSDVRGATGRCISRCGVASEFVMKKLDCRN